MTTNLELARELAHSVSGYISEPRLSELADDIAQAFASIRLDERAKAQQWQPISTFPDDIRHALVAWYDENFKEWIVEYTADGPSDEDCPENYRSALDYAKDIGCTLWMRITPPSAKVIADKGEK